MDSELIQLVQGIEPINQQQQEQYFQKLYARYGNTEPAILMGAAKLLSLSKEEVLQPLKKAILIFAADHAVDGVENKTHGKWSRNMAEEIAKGKGAINSAAHRIGAGVLLLELGMEQPIVEYTGVQDLQVMKGSHFWECRDAMSQQEMMDALYSGIQLAFALYQEGYHAIGLGNLGERAMITALVLTTAYCKSCFRQHNFSKQGAQVTSLLQHLEEKNISISDPLLTLQKVGAPDIAAMIGVILGAAYNRMCVTFDNAVTGAAVLMAQCICSACKEYLFTVVQYDEPVHQMQMNVLGYSPFLKTDFYDGMGMGSVLGLSVLDAAQKLVLT